MSTKKQHRAAKQAASQAATQNYVPSIVSRRPEPKVKIVLALPTHETMEAGFSYDMGKMMAEAMGLG